MLVSSLRDSTRRAVARTVTLLTAKATARSLPIPLLQPVISAKEVTGMMNTEMLNKMGYELIKMVQSSRSLRARIAKSKVKLTRVF